MDERNGYIPPRRLYIKLNTIKYKFRARSLRNLAFTHTQPCAASQMGHLLVRPCSNPSLADVPGVSPPWGSCGRIAPPRENLTEPIPRTGPRASRSALYLSCRGLIRDRESRTPGRSAAASGNDRRSPLAKGASYR